MNWRFELIGERELEDVAAYNFRSPVAAYWWQTRRAFGRSILRLSSWEHSIEACLR